MLPPSLVRNPAFWAMASEQQNRNTTRARTRERERLATSESLENRAPPLPRSQPHRHRHQTPIQASPLIAATAAERYRALACVCAREAPTTAPHKSTRSALVTSLAATTRHTSPQRSAKAPDTYRTRDCWRERGARERAHERDEREEQRGSRERRGEERVYVRRRAVRRERRSATGYVNLLEAPREP